MKKDRYKTKVYFRKWDNGQIIALFPDMPEDSQSKFITSYMHIGQHSGASKELIEDLQETEKSEYLDLFNELESLGYNLEVH